MTVGSIAQEYKYSSVDKGLFLAAFFIGYIPLQLIGGWLAWRFGGWAILGGVLATTSLALLLTPFAASSLGGLVAMRVIAGLCQSALFPTCLELLSQWIPRSERSLSVSLSWSGAAIGVALSLPVNGYIITAGGSSVSSGWRAVYYVWGAVGLVFAGLWFLLGSSSPELHPWAVSDAERTLIAGSRDRSGHVAASSVPWMRLLLHPAVFALVLANISCSCELRRGHLACTIPWNYFSSPYPRLPFLS